MLGQLLLRFGVGGLVVSAFAVIGHIVRPRTFAGIFGAAPSVSLATLGLTYLLKGAPHAATEGRSLIAGAIALGAYSLAGRPPQIPEETRVIRTSSTLHVSMPSEREKMLAGELYDSQDPELVARRGRARDLCQALNVTRAGDAEARRAILRELFGRGGDSVWMEPPFHCDYGANIELGERVFFNFNCVVLDVCPVRIGDYTMFGPAVQILTPMHPMNAVERRAKEYGRPVEIGSDVWVGGGALILPGVRIGSRSVIGAGSVVTRDVPEGVFAAGNPCRIVREMGE